MQNCHSVAYPNCIILIMVAILLCSDLFIMLTDPFIAINWKINLLFQVSAFLYPYLAYP